MAGSPQAHVKTGLVPDREASLLKLRQASQLFWTFSGHKKSNNHLKAQSPSQLCNLNVWLQLLLESVSFFLDWQVFGTFLSLALIVGSFSVPVHSVSFQI